MMSVATATSSLAGARPSAFREPSPTHTELPSTFDHLIAGPSTIPFPHYVHRHSSPFPMAPQSFSALGPPEDELLGPQPPPIAQYIQPPRPIIGNLPSAPVIHEIPLIGTLPPTPEPSPPDHKMLFPATMVELAPTAEDAPYRVDMTDPEEKGLREGSPRRLPSLRVDTSENATGLGRSKSTNHDVRGKLSQTNINADGKGRHKPKRSQTAYALPTATKMAPSRSADSRARLLANAGLPRSGSHTPYGASNSPGIHRAMSDATATPPRHSGSAAADLPPADLGGPDGLEAKVVLLGSQGVGKTSLILRYTTGTFSPIPAAATIGSSLHTRKLVHAGVRVKLQIWDTAGQERFRSMAPIYYRGAHVCILVYDISDRQSFEDVRSWLEELGRTVPKETVIFVAGAKIDLNDKRAVSLMEAKATIRSWLKPPSMTSSVLLSPPSKFNSVERRGSASSKPESILSSPTPSRSQSQGALANLESSKNTHSSPTPPVVPIMTALRDEDSQPRKVPFPTSKGHRHRQSIKIVLPTSPTSPRQLSFPTLQSPTGPTSHTTIDHDLHLIRPSSPTSPGHNSSGGRFSISGVLGYSRTQSMSGAMTNLARLAESNPVENRASTSTPARAPQPQPRVRTESSPMLSAEAVKAARDARRRSEDWSSRSWRMGEGPSAAEALGEFRAGVKKKESEELLASGSGGLKKPSLSRGRSRGSSLGRDSRLYGEEEERQPAAQADRGWGVDVEGVRLGECSALSGQGVDALFHAISTLLVERKDKLERERTLRHKNSIMLVDPAAAPAAGGSKGRYACCV